MKKILLKMKDKFNENQKRNMLILVILILTILSSITLITYSFYQNRSTNLIIAGVASIDKSDVRIKVYREDKDSSGNGTNTYTLSYYIPNSNSYSYNESKSSCDDGFVIESYENNIFNVKTTKKGTCKVYFDAIDGYIDDYEVNLFVQEEIGSTDDKNYKQMGELPLYETGYYYTINESKTSCSPSATSYLIGSEVYIKTNTKTICNVYVDKNIDNTLPTIENINASNNKLTAYINDNASLSYYGLSSSSDTEPEEWISINETPYSLSIPITKDTPYLWVKDSANNIKVSDEIIFGRSFSEIIVVKNETTSSQNSSYKYIIKNENGLRYEGQDPDNYICFDDKETGECTSEDYLFRIIGLFEEDYSIDGTNSSGTKSVVKLIKNTNYGSSGMYWNSNKSNNWSTASLKIELNGTYLNSLNNLSNINQNFINNVVQAKWHLGGISGSNYKTLTASGNYTEERNTNAIYSGNPASIYAKVGIMYVSDYAYAASETLNSATTCSRTTTLYSYNSCKTYNWLFNNTFLNGGEWVLNPISSNNANAAIIYSAGYVQGGKAVTNALYAVRPSLYIDAQAMLNLETDGSKTNPYRLMK